MVLRYRRKQRKLYDLSLQQLSTVPNNAEAVAAAAKAKVLYDDDAYTNPVYSDSSNQKLHFIGSRDCINITCEVFRECGHDEDESLCSSWSIGVLYPELWTNVL